MKEGSKNTDNRYSPEAYLALACEQSAVVSEVIGKYGHLSLEEYLERICPSFREPLQDRRDLLGVVKDYASDVLGEAAGVMVAQELAQCPVVMTANHHGVDFFAQSVQGTLLFSLAKRNGKNQGRVVPVFACGAVPLDTLTYPLGLLLYHGNTEHLDRIPRKLPVFPNRLRRTMVSVANSLDDRMVEKALR